MLILAHFFFAPAASLYLYDIGYLLLYLQRSYSILILGQRFSASSLYYFDLSFFVASTASLLKFSLIAGVWFCNFGLIFFMFWRHCPVMILARCYSCLCQAFVIVILALFVFALAGSLYQPVLLRFLFIFCFFLLDLYYGYSISNDFMRLWPT